MNPWAVSALSSLLTEVAAVETFVTDHCAALIAGIEHGEALFYEPLRAHAAALRNLERMSCLVSTVTAVCHCCTHGRLSVRRGLVVCMYASRLLVS